VDCNEDGRPELTEVLDSEREDEDYDYNSSELSAMVKDFIEDNFNDEEREDILGALGVI
jgi:hypothetical protein